MMRPSRIALRSLPVAVPIGCAAIALILARSPARPSAKAPVSAAEGPAMEIDPAEAAHAGEVRVDNALGMKFRRCPPGRFLMGDPPPGIPVTLRLPPGVPVTLRRGFWMGQFEVTQSQWQRVMGVTLREQRAKDPRQPRPVGDDTMRDHVGEGPDHPIYFVSYDDAVEFCRKFTEEERKAGRLPGGFEYRLPTEAQWEFACRAGTTTATAFGDRLGGLDANFDGTKPYRGAAVGPYLRETTPGGHYPANPWGLHDMHGNVWEWCLDGYLEKLPGGVDPLTPISGPRRSYRGGCWHNYGIQCLSTSRTWGNAGDRGSGLGFRVALVPTGP